MAQDSAELLREYSRIFSGCQDSFVIHVPPFTVNPAKNKLSASWAGVAKYGTKSFRLVPDGFEKDECVPMDIEHYRAHLNGDYGIALSPLIDAAAGKENVCPYGIIDIDYYSDSFTWLIARLYADGFMFSAFLSKSGGLHIYFMFEEYESAAGVRTALTKIVNMYGLDRLYSKDNVSKVEVFPEHDKRKPGMHDKCVFLPFYNAAGECKNKMLGADGKLIGIVKALPIVKKQFTTLKAVEAAIAALPYSDAPYCIQALLLSGALWDGSHRNDFLFTVALHLKMKHGIEGFTIEMLAEANERMSEPLEGEHVLSCYNSAISKDFPILGQCKKNPMVGWCNKSLCKERAFSAVKKDKNNVASNVEFGQVYRMMAEVPYYLLEAKLVDAPEVQFKTLRIDAAENFLNQRTVQKECIDKLGQIMWTVKQQIWEERLNEVLQHIVNKEVPKQTDTTELSELHELFSRFLTHKQAATNMPFRVTLKQVYKAGGKYYFQTDGLKDYLRIARYNLRCNLREQLLEYGCSEGEVAYVRRDGTSAIIKCWVKDEDAALAEMMVHYDDAVDQDSALLEQNILKKDDEDEPSDTVLEEAKF